MSEQNQPRNAAAGARQKAYVRQDNATTHRQFGDYGLTKRNEEFMFQLNKQLDQQGMKAEKKTDALKETIEALLEGQKKGATAKQLFDTPTKKANDLIHGPAKATNQQSSFWLLAADNGLMFFNIFTLLFGAMGFFQPKSLQTQQSGTTGIVAILLVGIIGGMLFAWVTQILTPPAKKKKQPIWFRIIAVVVALAAWIGVYFVASMLPNVVNPQLPAWAYLTLGVLGFVADLYLRRKYHIVGGAFGSPQQNRRRR
ncbi:DUF1129 domain-containing protein [Paucilactobacillus wasatchensis]|uniref:Putative membrane protein n=1 Tax=Paucilactobacillus wasatchensis TaxID=1335616 RepID=A0A0D0YYQ5_9LACO|nr:DUF1129 domain-containing protein [Paucilactobacillus wasatchensis]KIS04359.1 putative membrane protein [Paucilactobacillus wasatchensis]